MGIKVVVMIKRKPGTSFADFQAHYENSHAKLGEKYFGSFLKEYRRNYISEAVDLSVPPNAASPAYDCLTELIFKDGYGVEDLTEVGVANPAIRQILTDDEERFLDRSGCRVAICTVAESDPADLEACPA